MSTNDYRDIARRVREGTDPIPPTELRALLASAILLTGALSEEMEAQRKELRETKNRLDQLLKPERSSYIDVFDYSKWPEILTSEIEAERAARWIEVRYDKILTGRGASERKAELNMFKAHMKLYATVPEARTAPPTETTARGLIAAVYTAIQVAHSGLGGVAAIGLRENLLEPPLPQVIEGALKRALDTAKTSDPFRTDKKQPNPE